MPFLQQGDPIYIEIRNPTWQTLLTGLYEWEPRQFGILVEKIVLAHPLFANEGYQSVDFDFGIDGLIHDEQRPPFINTDYSAAVRGKAEIWNNLARQGLIKLPLRGNMGIPVEIKFRNSERHTFYDSELTQFQYEILRNFNGRAILVEPEWSEGHHVEAGQWFITGFTCYVFTVT